MKLIELDKKIFLHIHYMFSKKTTLKKIIRLYIKLCHILYCFLYSYLILYLYLNNNLQIKVIIIPLTVYMLLKITRVLIKRRRPFLIFPDLVLPHKKQYSLPSNHTGASFIISYTFLYFNLYIGSIMIILSIFLGISRVIEGIHFPLDIFCGFILATFAYMFFYIF